MLRRVGAPWFFLCVLISFPLSGVPLNAQSTSAKEEQLRAGLLKRLESDDIGLVEDLRPYYRRDLQIPFRKQPGANIAAAIELGRKLFFEKRISTSGKLSCASCHMPEKYWTDGLAQSSEGNSRRSMALFNLAWDGLYTWHGRAGTLMSQSILAMTAPRGMGANMLDAAKRLSADSDYLKLSAKAFPLAPQRITPEIIGAAVEYYVASRISGNSAFDRWVDGDEAAIGVRAKRGFLKFHITANCGQCHNLWRFSDSRRYDIGLREVANSDREPKYKAVGLRNIAKRPPYMHDGSLETLEEVLQFYVRGGDELRKSKSPLIRPLRLSLEDQAEILIFLQSLTDSKPPTP